MIVAATVVALMRANPPRSHSYMMAWATHFSLRLGRQLGDSVSG
jgi:Na+/H+ antiporter NhaA